LIVRVRDYFELTKTCLTAMVILTTWLGYAFVTGKVT